jgi:hypothetical protein
VFIYLELTIKLIMHKEQYYLAMFGRDARFNVKYTLTPAGISLALEEKWMTLGFYWHKNTNTHLSY